MWKIPRNPVEILSNTCLYNILETSFSYRGYLLAVNFQSYLGTSLLKRANNVPKLLGINYVAKNWALAMMLKALSLVHSGAYCCWKSKWWPLLEKHQKTLVWSGQNQSMSNEICPKNNHKIGFFYQLLSGQVCPENFREIGRFFRDFVPENPAKFDFFFRDLSEALLRRQTPLHQQKGVRISVPLKMKMSPKNLAKGTNCPPVIKS